MQKDSARLISYAMASTVLVAVCLLVVISNVPRQGVSGLSQTSLLGTLGAMFICAAAAWYITGKIYRHRLRTREQELNDQMIGEISFRDSAIESHCIVSVTDPDGRYLRVNDKFLTTFGYSEEEILGHQSDVLYFENGGAQDDLDTKTNVEDCHGLLAASRKGKLWSGEQVLKAADGTNVVTATTIIPHFGEDGQHAYSVCLRTDITSQKLSEAKRQLCQVLDDLQDEVFIFEVDSLQIQYMNKAALSRFGWTAEAARQKPISATSPNFDVALFRSHTAPLVSGQREVVAIQAQHGTADIEISTRLHRDGRGQLLFLSVLRDISSRKRIEKARMEGIANVSHELRTPLTSIKGALALATSGKMGEVGTEVGQLLDIANRNSDHLLMMVDDILDLERMGSGEMRLDVKEEDMLDLANEARDMNATLGQGIGLAIEVTTDDGDFRVVCDRKRISQVITNLISNAAKYSPENGVIDIHLSRNGNTVRICVSDTGPGISKEDQARLFNSFARAEPTDGKRRKGTGLGLAICKKIISLHNGKIFLKSNIGQGTSVYCDIPAAIQTSDETVVELNGTPGTPSGRALPVDQERRGQVESQRHA